MNHEDCRLFGLGSAPGVCDKKVREKEKTFDSELCDEEDSTGHSSSHNSTINTLTLHVISVKYEHMTVRVVFFFKHTSFV